LGDPPRKAQIRDRYDDLGGRLYDLRYGEEQRAKYREALSLVQLEPWMVALDNGCGTGLLEEELDTYVVGLDLSQALLRKARARTTSKERVHLALGDSENLPIRDSVLDATFSFTVLQNLPHPEKMLTESRRASSHGAHHVVSTHRKTMTLDELRALIEKTHLKIVRLIDTENANDWIVLAK
jgi:ubiquinone/menaquinone biosynthesis C-methylase UbiE